MTIAELTDDAVELTAWAAELNDGTRSWQEWDPDLGPGCPDRQFAACEEAAIAARDAWKRLERAEWMAARWWRRLANRRAPRLADRWYRRGSK